MPKQTSLHYPKHKPVLKTKSKHQSPNLLNESNIFSKNTKLSLKQFKNTMIYILTPQSVGDLLLNSKEKNEMAHAIQKLRPSNLGIIINP